MKSFKEKANWPTADAEAHILNLLNHKNIIKFQKLFKTKTSV